MRYLSDHHNAEDAVIQSFTRAFKNLRSFSHTGPGSLGRWIRTITINESIRILKKKQLVQFDDNLHGLDNESTDTSGLEQLKASDLVRMIEQLPSGYRTVFNLFVVEGYSHKEIAGLLGVSENTSKTQLKKARGQLITKIQKAQSYGTL